MTSSSYILAFQIVSTVTLGLIGFWLKDWKSKIEEQIQQNTEDIKEIGKSFSEEMKNVNKSLADEIKTLDKSFADFKTQMPYNYTLREDFIRVMANLEKRQEKMYTTFEQSLEKINGKMEQKLDNFFSLFTQKIDGLNNHLNDRKEG